MKQPPSSPSKAFIYPLLNLLKKIAPFRIDLVNQINRLAMS